VTLMAMLAPLLRSRLSLAGLVLGWLAASASGVGAQPRGALGGQSLPTEKVIVSAPKLVPDAVLHDFIQAYTAPSPASGKVARWKDGICPIVTGLPPAANKLVTERVRQVAGMVGAPVGAARFCKPNIDIVFTFKPQLLLDEVRTKTPVLLGYHDVSQEKALATVIHPVQAWYTTQTVDVYGTTYVDDRLSNHGGYRTATQYGVVFVPDARVEHTTGTRLMDNGLSSELYHVIIVIDLAKVDGRTIGALADYAAMLSLAQTQTFEICQPVASITNLVSPGCAAAVKTNDITDNDLAYLHGLYSIDSHSSFLQQRDDIAYQMKKGLEKR
jgi:hypothetical protein